MARRIALLHFTAEPCVGGVERVIEEQRRILAGAGHIVRLIVGAGGEGKEVIRLPELVPPQDACNLPIPEVDDPDVQQLEACLEQALAAQDACWVHNVLTVYLHPCFTVALIHLISRRPEIQWAAFCHDITATSAFWRRLSRAEHSRLRLPERGIRYVVDSTGRRSQLEELRGLESAAIQVMPPPLPSGWLVTTSETRALVDVASLGEEPIILVPSRLLPHKNLELSVRALAELRTVLGSTKLVITGAISPHQPGESLAVMRALHQTACELGVERSVVIASEVLGKAPTRDTVRELTQLADLVFLPSAEEGYGLPMLEAIALRTPMLCSDIPPFREIGDGYAQFFSLSEPPREIAQRACAILTGRPAVIRRHALASGAAYTRAVRSLADK